MIDWKKIRSYGSKLTGEERERYDRFVDNLAWSVEHFEDEVSIEDRYAKLTPENRAKVDRLIDALYFMQ